jgi:hypothetical protein
MKRKLKAWIWGRTGLPEQDVEGGGFMVEFRVMIEVPDMKTIGRLETDGRQCSLEVTLRPKGRK